jgi:hypothetical protein
LCNRDKIIVFGHKISLAAKRRDSSRFAVGAAFAHHQAFGSFSLGAFGQSRKTFFSQYVRSLLDIAVGFLKRPFAIHHSLSGHFPQFHHHCC